MKTNQAGENLIKHYESLELKAYPDPESNLGKACAAQGFPMHAYQQIDGWENLDGGPWTIGWGHTGGVSEGDEITENQAEQIFIHDCSRFEAGIENLVTVELTDNQFSALTCFVFNVGLEEFRTSTLLKKLLASDFEGAANEFPRWNHSKGRVVPGLTERRKSEQALFLTPDGEE